MPGAEEGPGGWGPWITGSAPGKSLLFAFGTGFFSNLVYEKADWDYRQAKVEEAFEAAQKKTAHILDATDANLTAFKAPGREAHSLPRLERPRDLGPEHDSVLRPGGGPAGTGGGGCVRASLHGPGDAALRRWARPELLWPARHRTRERARRDVSMALEQWVEKGMPPSAIVATKYVNDDPAKGVKTSRPLCPHPQTAKYKGQGDPNEAASFLCASASP